MPAPLELFGVPLTGVRLVEASAGTGKTWTICGLYVRLLLEAGLSVRDIVVVTFTRAATGELKERIRRRLVSLQRALEDGPGAPEEAHDDPFVPMLLAHIDGPAYPVDRKAALERLRLAVVEFDEASVFTIHGFCQRALAEVPFSAGLPFAYEVIADDSRLVDRVVADFYRLRIVAGDLDDRLVALLGERVAPPTLAQHLRRRLSRPLTRLEFEVGVQGDGALARYDQLFEEARALWVAERDEIVRRVRAAIAAKALKGTSYKETTLIKSQEAWDALLGTAQFALPTAKSALKYLRAGHLAQQAASGRTPPKHPFFDLAQSLAEAQPAADQQVERTHLSLVRELLEDWPRRVRALKARRRVIAYDDMLYNLYAALSDTRLAWLAGALRTRYPAALIDEFQDTDPLQLEIFSRIYGEGREGGPAFLVGDPKQSIYAFRDADLYAYLRAARAAQGRIYGLTENQRSTPALLRSLNALFTRSDAPFLLPDLAYHEVISGRRPLPAFRDKEGGAAMQVWLLPGAGGGFAGKADCETAAVEATAAEISRLLAAGRRGEVLIGSRGIAPADIAVIVRRHDQGAAVKRALARLGIGSVERSQDSVIVTEEAKSTARVLAALAEPADDRQLRAALATELFGLCANDIEREGRDEATAAQWLNAFARLRELWRTRGFAAMWRTLLEERQVVGRLLPREGGERAVTNYLHLGELLQRAEQETHGMEGLLRWFQAARAGGHEDEENQLRLESDERLVQIVTVHVAKGLEYPVAFCPFLWSARTAKDDPLPAAYHDEDGRAVERFGGDLRQARAHGRREQMAEELRLIYVALTRAIYRCYLVAGVYAHKQDSGRQACGSPLNWLVAGKAARAQAWLGGEPPGTDAILGEWKALTQACDAIVISGLPRAAGEYYCPEFEQPPALHARVATRALRESWSVASFTSLNAAEPQGRAPVFEEEAADRDERVTAQTVEEASVAEEDSLAAFPRGAAAGVLLHAVFEHADLAAPSTWDGAIERAVASHPVERSGERPHALRRTLRRALENVCATRLDGRDLILSAIPSSERLHELTFSFSAREVETRRLTQLLRHGGLPVDALAAPRIQGYLRGAIDCVLRHDGRFHLIDWKSNYLGAAREDYGEARLARVMTEEGYRLQYALYSLALHRYLRRRLPGYEYERHFGGVFYVFVRGCRPDWVQADGMPAGVFRARLSRDLMDGMDRLFHGEAAAEARP